MMEEESLKELVQKTRRRSLEYTIGSGNGAKQRVGREATEKDIESWNPPKTKAKTLGFSLVQGSGAEAPNAAFATIPTNETECFTNLTEDEIRNNGRKSPSESHIVSKKSKQPPTVGFVSVQCSVAKSDKDKTKKKKSRSTKEIAESRTSRNIKNTDSSAFESVGKRVDAETRLKMKSKHCISGLVSRNRPNIKEKLEALDERSKRRWDVSSKLEYEERLTQGIAVFPKAERMIWIAEHGFVENKDPTEEEIAQRKLRRAKHSICCSNIFRDPP